MSTYVPGVVASFSDVYRELLKIRQAMERGQTSVTFDYLHAEPDKLVAGMVVAADGTDWNPGSGAGMYRRNEANSAWVFLG